MDTSQGYCTFGLAVVGDPEVRNCLKACHLAVRHKLELHAPEQHGPVLVLGLGLAPGAAAAVVQAELERPELVAYL